MDLAVSNSRMAKPMKDSIKMTRNMVMEYSIGLDRLIRDAMKDGGQMENKTVMELLLKSRHLI